MVCARAVRLRPILLVVAACATTKPRHEVVGVDAGSGAASRDRLLPADAALREQQALEAKRHEEEPAEPQRALTAYEAKRQERIALLDRKVSAARPELGVELLVPDFHDDLRWPLTTMSHPDL